MGFMRVSYRRRPSPVDVLLALWVATWIAIALITATATRDAAALSGTVAPAADAAAALAGALGSVPLLGGELGDVAAQIEQVAAEAREDAERTESGAERLSVLLALAIIFIPASPVLGFYLPVRVRRIREADRLRESLHRHGRTPGFAEFLAARAVDNLGYEELLRVTESPYEDLRSGRHTPLAAAELRRVGIEPPSWLGRPPADRA